MKKQEKSQLKIYIDSSQRDKKKVVLVKILDHERKELDVIEGDVDVVGSIKKILEKNNLKLKDVSEFIPRLGPGSFTGLKIGVTVSNVLNWLLKRKKLNELYIPEYGGEPNISERKKK